MPDTPASTPTITMEITSLCSDDRCLTKVCSMSSLNMLGTSTWKIRLMNDSTIAVMNVTRWDFMTGRTRCHQGRLLSREISWRGPGYLEVMPPRGFTELSRSSLLRSEREEDTNQFYRLLSDTQAAPPVSLTPAA